MRPGHQCERQDRNKRYLEGAQSTEEHQHGGREWPYGLCKAQAGRGDEVSSVCWLEG